MRTYCMSLMCAIDSGDELNWPITIGPLAVGKDAKFRVQERGRDMHGLYYVLEIFYDSYTD